MKNETAWKVVARARRRRIYWQVVRTNPDGMLVYHRGGTTGKYPSKFSTESKAHNVADRLNRADDESGGVLRFLKVSGNGMMSRVCAPNEVLDVLKDFLGDLDQGSFLGEPVDIIDVFMTQSEVDALPEWES